MLLELQIKNFVLIDELLLKFKKGLNILTGETGAGKSILIDALSGVLGEKMTTDMIRSDSDKAILQGVFDISKLPQVKSILDESGIDYDNEFLVLKRELFLNGKGRCFANSTQIPVSKLKEISDYLVDIHGQNEHQSIVRITRHRELLDSYAGHQDLVTEISKLHHKLNDLQKKLDSLESNEQEKSRRKEYLEFAINEICSANLLKNEEENLINESQILSNAEKLFAEINNSSMLMKDDGGIIQNLKRVEQCLDSISEYDANISNNLATVREAIYLLEDVSIFLRNYEKNIGFSPQRINEVEERLSSISRLKKKYGNSLEQILEYASKAEQELNAISYSDEEIEKLNEDYISTMKTVKDLAFDLSDRRKHAAKELEDKVMAELKELGMEGTTLRISIKREFSPDGQIEFENKKYILYPHGLDKIEFLLSANEGEDLKQLRRVASGGEMSRIMLALKKVILSADIVESLVFDEVDAGIGGKIADIVGKKLKSLSKDRQVLVITHLPQIAAMSDTHFIVLKDIINNRTTTHVKTVAKEEKVREIARMLAGEKITDLTLKHAEEMIGYAELS